MSITKDVRFQRIEQRRCVQCGIRLEDGDNYKSCVFCREYARRRYYRTSNRKHRPSTVAKEHELENKFQMEYAKKRTKETEDRAFSEQAMHCMLCEFGTFTGVSVYCPSADGTCLKNEMNGRTKVAKASETGQLI